MSNPARRGRIGPPMGESAAAWAGARGTSLRSFPRERGHTPPCWSGLSPWLVLCVVLTTGCAVGASPEPVEWTYTYQCEVDRERATRVLVRVLRDGCSGDQTVHLQSLNADQRPIPADDLAAGLYALEMIAFDGEEALARACTEVALPANRSVALTLQAVDACDAMGRGCSMQSECDCAEDRERCGAQCVDVSTNDSHCGQCDTACSSGASCTRGRCTCRDDATLCDGECVDTQRDAEHCGGCGAACTAEGSVCVQGACACDADSGLSDCGTAEALGCVDTDTSAEHCGGCGSPCPTDVARCEGGQCLCNDGGLFCGEAGCVDAQSDNGHCGGCGVVCAADQQCQAGRCECVQEGFRNCDGRCVDARNDIMNCGGCGTQCPPATTQCVEGNCRCLDEASNVTDALSLCSPRQPLNEQSCHDLTQDDVHCGSCDNACAGDTSCVDGTCSCPKDASLCNENQCKNLSKDDEHCGACNRPCTGETHCENSACTCPNGAAAVCDGDRCCPGDMVCGDDGTSCSCPASQPTVCDGDAGVCADLNTSVEHCGRCGRACGAGFSCQNGACKPGGAGSCTAVPYGDHDYLFCGNDSWGDARGFCQGLSGRWDLVVVDDADENAFLAAQINAIDNGIRWWLGLSDGGGNCESYANCRDTGEDGEGDFYWITPGGAENGTLLCTGNRPCTNDSRFTNWYPDEPNNDCRCPLVGSSHDEDCAEIGGDGRWNDQRCERGRRIICESY